MEQMLIAITIAKRCLIGLAIGLVALAFGIGYWLASPSTPPAPLTEADWQPYHEHLRDCEFCDLKTDPDFGPVYREGCPELAKVRDAIEHRDGWRWDRQEGWVRE